MPMSHPSSYRTPPPPTDVMRVSRSGMTPDVRAAVAFFAVPLLISLRGVSTLVEIQIRWVDLRRERQVVVEEGRGEEG